MTRRKNIRSTFEAAVGQHSEKPAIFYDIVESLRDGPFVELFAPRPRAGWTSLGDQVPVNDTPSELDSNAVVSARRTFEVRS